jgi:DNA-binding XRE family transcriptional regulator
MDAGPERRIRAQFAREASAMSTVTASERRRVGLAFGAALRAARKHKGMTQEQLADAAGVDRTFPTLLERGLRTPTLGTLLRLAEALGVSAEALVEDTRSQMGRADST